LCSRSATRPRLTRRDYWLAAGAAEVTMSSFVLLTIASSSPRFALGHSELRQGLVEVVHERIPLRARDEQLAVRV
jgi:hypothetical protein